MKSKDWVSMCKKTIDMHGVQGKFQGKSESLSTVAGGIVKQRQKRVKRQSVVQKMTTELESIRVGV